MRRIMLAATCWLMLAAPALAADGGPGGLGNRNVNIDPHVRFPGGAAPGEASSSLGAQVGGRLSPATMRDHPATEANTTGWGGTTAVPGQGPIDPLANGAGPVPPGTGAIGGTGGDSGR